MRTRTFAPGTFLLLLLALFILTGEGFAADSLSLPASVASRPLPTGFEQNFGQAEAGVRYIGRSAAGTVFLTDQGMELAVFGSEARQRIRLRLLGAGKAALRGEGATGGVVNYYRTRERKNWLTGIPIFGRVRYANAYPGVDVVYHGNEGKLEYDFEVAPGGSANQIAIAVEGAEAMEVAGDGSLEIHAAGQTWRLLPPIAYQLKQGTKQRVRAEYEITKPDLFTLKLGAYDREAALVIDPVVQYSQILGLNNGTQVKAVSLDSSGNLIFVGSTFSSDYPVVNPLPNQGFSSAIDPQSVVTKLNAAGDTILFSTYIACPVTTLALDATDNIYMAGSGAGSSCPVTSTVLGTAGGVAVKLSPTGQMEYSALLGGISLLTSLAVDATGDAILAGLADCTLQTVNAFQAAPPCPTCGGPFFAKLNSTGTSYVFSSYFFGPNASSSPPFISAVAVDGTGNLYLGGQGSEPQVKPWQVDGGLFVSKFAPDGQTLLFSTAFANGSETLARMTAGSDGTIYLFGSTPNNDYPYTINASRHPDGPGSGSHLFATAINPTQTGLTYSTYIADGNPGGMFLGANNHLYVAGNLGGQLPLQNAVVSDVSTGQGGFYVELDPLGQPVTSSRFGGHMTLEAPTAITADGSGNIYIAGGVSPQNESPGPDPILVGPAFNGGLTGGNFGVFFAKISQVNAAAISVDTVGKPFLVLRNAGTADLHISSMTFSAGRTFGNCGAVVPGGTSCVVTVGTVGGKIASGTLTITSDAQPATTSVDIVFPPAEIGATIGDFLWFDDDRRFLPPRLSQTIPFHIWNVGAADSVINLIDAGSAGATETNDCGTGLAPGAGCTVQLTMPGGAHGIIVFYDNGPFKDFQFFAPQVSQDPALSISTIIFPTQFVGGIALPRTVTVTNTGGSDITVTPVLTADPEFTIAGDTCPALLPAGQSCAVGILFTPVIDGFRSGVLTIDGSSVQLGARGEINSAVQVSPLQQDFAPTVIHLASQTLPIVLTNTLTTAAPITGIAFSLPDYTETDDCAGQVPANGSCTVQVKFTPQALGARGATMTVNFTGAATQILTLTGGGVTPFVINSHNLNFIAPVGGTSAEQGDGMGNRLFVSEGYTFTLTGPFAIAQNPCLQPMPPNGTSGCAPTIVFQPTAPGPQQGTFTISYAGITEQDVVTLNGIASTVSASPQQLNFPLTKIGASSTLDLTLTNSGAAGVAITSVSTVTPYTEADTCQGVVPANGACVLHVTFTPQTATFPVTGTVNISLADGAQYSVGLAGTGTGPVITISIPGGTKFPDQVVGTSRTDQFAVSIINNGDAPLNIASITMSSGDFTQTNNCPASLVSTCQISVTFKPSTVGLRSGNLTLTDDGLGSPQQVVFTGTGNDFQVSTGSSASATVTAGQTATFNLSYSAVGSFSGQVQVACSGAPQLATCSLSSPNVNLIGSVPVPLTVTVKTTPHTIAAVAVPGGFNAGINLIGGLILLPLVLVSKSLRKAGQVRTAVGITCLAALLLITSCGGGGTQATPAPSPTQGGTPAGTYALTVTSTDQTINGPVVHQTDLMLVVK